MRWVLEFFAKRQQLYDRLMLVSDAIGLGVFTAIGVAAAYHISDEYSMFLYIFVGVVTGIGGGVLRDTMASVPPYVFVKHFYGTASIIGAVLCVLVWKSFGETSAIFACTTAVIVLRLLAAKYRWKLPNPQDREFYEGLERFYGDVGEDFLDEDCTHMGHRK